jgi:hypothetical protein
MRTVMPAIRAATQIDTGVSTEAGDGVERDGLLRGSGRKGIGSSSRVDDTRQRRASHGGKVNPVVTRPRLTFPRG